MNRLLAIAALLTCACIPRPGHAAESFDNCVGYITSIPTTISTQGVWCLRRDVSMANSSGNAISVNANNVTIDCNDFKIGGLAAGNGSQALGIYSSGRQNVTVRRCGIRGFRTGISLQNGAGFLVEDSRLDNNLQYGIVVSGDNSRVRHNAVYDTGGATGVNNATAIYGTANVMDNDVRGVYAAANPSFVTGIYASGDVVSGNQISGLEPNVSSNQGYARGIWGSTSVKTSVVNNQIYGRYSPYTTGTGIYSVLFCANNTTGGFSTVNFCSFSSGNLNFPVNP